MINNRLVVRDGMHVRSILRKPATPHNVEEWTEAWLANEILSALDAIHMRMASFSDESFRSFIDYKNTWARILTK